MGSLWGGSSVAAACDSVDVACELKGVGTLQSQPVCSLGGGGVGRGSAAAAACWLQCMGTGLWQPEYSIIGAGSRSSVTVAGGLWELLPQPVCCSLRTPLPQPEDYGRGGSSAAVACALG